ncbi:intein-containing Rv2578c family radical SAM protein [Microbacterium sp. NPDC055683]
MRWNGQRIGEVDASALPGLDRLDGLVRTVTTPEFAGLTFHEVAAKSALNHVPGPSSMPFDWTVNPYRGCSHACVYCLSPDTLILRADGRGARLRDLRIGDEIIGTERDGAYRRYVATTVQAKWPTRKRAYRIMLADGTEIVASGDHRFLTERGWKHVTGTTSGAERRPHLTTGNRLLGFGQGRGPILDEDEDDEYRLGYLTGMIRGDGMLFHGTYADGRRTRSIHRFRLALADEQALDRTRRYLDSAGVVTMTRPFVAATGTRRAMNAIHTARRADVARIETLIEIPADPSASWDRGFLAGFFDAEGSASPTIRMSNKDGRLLEVLRAAADRFDFASTMEPVRPNGVTSLRLLGGLPARRRFFDIVRPAITRKLALLGMAVKTFSDLRVVSIVDVGHEIEMLDITTGTGDFIANGVVSHNCFARGTHEYLELDAGRDFDSQIVVKVNIADVLRRELAKPGWQREHVALGTNTDPYQRAEGRYRLMPGIIDALADSGTPFSVLTKGTLLRRDLPQLAARRADVDISLAMSIAVHDDALQRAIEPGTPTARARLDTVKAAADLGFRVQVFLMPIVPHLSDSVEALDEALTRIRAAGAHRVVYGAMHLRPGVKPWFFQWLARERPDLVAAYRGLYPGASVEAPKGYRTWLAQRIRPLLRAHGLAGSAEEDQPPRTRSRAKAPPRFIETGRTTAPTLF